MKTDLEAIKKRVAAAIRGPWLWVVNPHSKSVDLQAQIGGLETVLDPVRWGMGSAAIRFQRDGLMVRCDELLKIVPGREHHRDWHQTIDHPDANFIAHARQDIPALVEEIEKLRAVMLALDGLSGPEGDLLAIAPGPEEQELQEAYAAAKAAGL